MPAKKKPAKAASKGKAKPAAKSKPAPKPKAAAKKPVKVENKPAPQPVAPAPPRKIEIVVPPPPVDPKDLVDCTHCDATGTCAAGQPYDKTHHQGVFGKIRLTSCQECLVAAGESHNSKKMVDCRFCKGSGKVPKTPAM